MSEDMNDLARKACMHLSAMVGGSLQSGQMPPRPIFEWFIEYALAILVQTEQDIMEGDTSEDIASALERAVVTVAELMRVCDVNDLFVFKEKIITALNARRLRLPPSYDHTYEGMLHV